MKFFLSSITLAAATELDSFVDAGSNTAAQWNWDDAATSRAFSGADYATPTHFDTNYFAALIGTNGHDGVVLHPKQTMPKVGLTSMEKVTAVSSESTRASIRAQLVNLLKQQVAIENSYTNKKEKLYLSAGAVYNFIQRLLTSACNIALSNDGLWQEQMQCFTAYKQLLEVYAMWNGVRDITFALDNGMAVTKDSFAVCRLDKDDVVVSDDMFVAHNPDTQRLQNNYLVTAVQRKCYDNLQIKVEALRRWLSQLLIDSDDHSERAQSCLFKTITVLTCLSAGNQEAILDLSIREEHKQKVVYTMSRYASTAIAIADGGHDGEATNTENSVNPTVGGAPVAMREIRPLKNGN